MADVDLLGTAPSADPAPCPACGSSNPPGFRFCGACGTSLERACPVCGASNPAGNRFCGACGTDLTGSAPATTDPAVRPEPEGGVAERKVVTALFADLTASTELAARLDPEDLRGILSPFFKAMVEEIERFGGTVEKFIGDAVVAVFGAPVAHEDDPERAVRAALAMQRRLGDLNRELLSESYGTELAMRIGVNTGEVVTATGVDREGLVTGEVMNIAARFQTLAEPGAIVVADRTRRDARDAFEFRSMGEVAVKGIDRPLAAWTVESERAGRPARATTFRAPLVGRDGELELLRLLLARTTKERRANLATVIGPAGIGKSRLTHEFTVLAQLEDPPPVHVRGRCLPYGEGLTYWPLAEIVKADAGIMDSDAAGTIEAKARRRLEERLPGEGRGTGVANVLLSSIGLASDSDPLAGADPAAAKETIARSWRAYFEALAAEAPVVALIEDLHWADPSLLDLLESLAARLAAPVLLLCTARPDLAERRPTWAGGLRNATTIELSPLGGEDSGRLVDHLLGEGDAPAEAVDAVLARAEGNPFFAGELVQMLVEDGYLVRGDAGWRLERPMPASLPDTVQGVIASRIDLLPPEEKRLIQDAAVVGRTFWEGSLRALGSPDPGRPLEGLLDKGLVIERDDASIEGERELFFNHVLTRDVAYAGIPRARRGPAHAEAGSWIESVTGGRAEEFAEILAHHFDLAGDAGRTARYAVLAGHRKRRVFAAEDAVRWYTRALEAPSGAGEPALLAEASLHRGEALEQLGSFPEAEADYRRAEADAASAGEDLLEARAVSALAHVLWLQDRFDDGRAVLDRALPRIAEVGASELEARLLYTAGTISFGRGEFEDGLVLQERCVEVARASGDREGEAFGLHGVCEVKYFIGPLTEAYQAGLEADRILRAERSRLMFVHNGYMVAWCLMVGGRQPDAMGLIDEVIRVGDELGARRDSAFAFAARAYGHLNAGNLAASMADGEAALRAAGSVASPRLDLAVRAWHLFTQAELHLAGEFGDSVARSVETAQAIGGAFFLAPSLAWRALMRVRGGDVAGALEDFARADVTSASRFHRMSVDRVRLVAAEELRDATLARAAGTRLVEDAAAHGSPSFEAWGRYGLALAAEIEGDAETALRQAEDAAARAEAAPDLLAAWRARLTAADALAALGRAGEAETRRASAAELVADLQRGLDAASSDSFRSGPLQARLLAEAPAAR